MDGWIKIYRQITKWEWYKNYVVKDVFLHLLLLANHDEQMWEGVSIQRGQVVTSYSKLADALGFTVQQVRTAINKLKSTREITYKSTSKYSLITIEKYNEYQETFFETNKAINAISNNQSTSNQQAINKQSTTNKNDKNNIIYIYINKIKEKKIELEKDHSKFSATLLARKWILEQPDFLELPEEEKLEIQRRIMLEV